MILKLFPFIAWFKNYSFNDFRIDAISGLTVALVLIPQSMAYAQLAGLPAYYGLYASFLPPMIASLFGSSRQLATGPVAVVSLMTSASLEPLATAGSEAFIAYAVLMALIVGVFQLALGILRLGIVVNFLSHPVVNGFTNAAAIIIATSQLSKIFGVYVDKAEHHYETIIRVCVSAVHYTHIPTFLMGAAAFGIMYGLRRINPKIPNVLVAVAVTTIISWAVGFEKNEYIDIESIQSSEIRELIKSYNQNTSSIAPLSEKRVKISESYDNAKSNNDHGAMLKLEYNLSIVNFELEKFKHESHLRRKEIRNYLFEKNGSSDSKSVFIVKDKNDIEGGIWRIKVNNFSIDTAKICMTGGGAVVGNIPKGLPVMSIPSINLKVILQLLPFAAIISLLGFMEAISIAKAMASKSGQRLDPNQELIGQGLANILGAIGKSYPVSGSFSRSAVNFQAGAISGLSSVFTSLAVVIVLLFFTPLLYHLPQSVLAAVIMMAVIGLINVSGFVHAWHAQWYDGLISIITFIFTLGFAPHLDKGIMIGVVLSLMVFIYKSMRPKVASLSRHEDQGLKNALIHNLMECKYIDLIRFEGTLFFANATYLEDMINERIRNKPTLRHIIIAANGINDMDATGEESLSLIISNVRSSGVDISFSGFNESVMSVLKRTHLYEKIGSHHIYATMEKAVYGIYEKAHRGGDEKTCPLLTVCRIIEDNKE